MSTLAIIIGVTSCGNNCSAGDLLEEHHSSEWNFLTDAIKNHSQDVQKVDIIDSTVVYTHIYDGIVDVKTYTYDGDVCVEVERVYTFPNQMKALRHYRRAVEQAALYNDIELEKNKVRYDLKRAQHFLETEGLTKEQLKAGFEKQISEAKADWKKHNDKVRSELKKDGERIEKDLDCCR